MRRGDLFVLSWESLRRVEWGKVSSFLSMSGGGQPVSAVADQIFFNYVDPNVRILEYKTKLSNPG